MGLDIYLTWPDLPKVKHVVEKTGYSYETDEDVPSEQYPEHLWKRNYLRSSYNGSGFDSAVGNLCDGHDLYWVFEQMRRSADDPYGGDFTPTDEQLLHARGRALELLEDLKGRESIGVMWESATHLRPQDGVPASEEDALRVYRAEVAREDPIFDGYSNSAGLFALKEPYKVHAIITGRGFGGSGHYIVFEKDMEWYIQACEILIEFIDEALSHPERSISWSG